jgi:hypothetical protein
LNASNGIRAWNHILLSSREVSQGEMIERKFIAKGLGFTKLRCFEIFSIETLGEEANLPRSSPLAEVEN